MLTLMPQLLISTVTALASWERQRQIIVPGGSRARKNTDGGLASLRFVQFAGFWSHYMAGRYCSSWPLPPLGGTEELVRFVEEFEGCAPSPRAGDIFLLACIGDAGVHSRAGVVIEVESAKPTLNNRATFICITAEGEVRLTKKGPLFSRVGFVRRRLSLAYGDRFIRWCDLPVRVSPSGKDAETSVRHEVPDSLITLERARSRRVA